MNFDEWMASWYNVPVTQRHIDYDHTFACQCVDLILDGLFKMHSIPRGVSGNAIDYWTNPSPAVLEKFTPLRTSEAVKGDVVILRTLGRTDNTGDGHIGWATGNADASNTEIFEQNGYGGGDGLPYPDGRHRNEIGTRSIPKSRIAGVLRPKPVQLSAPYTVEDIPTKEIELKENHYLWNMVYRTKEDIEAHPVQGYSGGYHESTAAICHHICGESYYMVGNNETTGFNVKDVRAYVEPPAQVYVPPAAPVIPKQAEKYPLKHTVMYFATYENCRDREKPVSTISPRPGDYFVFDKKGGLFEVSEDNQATAKNRKWINTADDKDPEPELSQKTSDIISAAGEAAQQIAEPVTTPPSPPATILNPDAWKLSVALPHGPGLYMSTNTVEIPIRALDGGLPATQPLPPHSILTLVSAFEGGKYVRDDLLKKHNRYYALPASLFTPYSEPQPAPVQRRLDINHDGDVNSDDFIDFGNRYLKPAFKAVAGVAKSVKTKQFIDGFTRRRK